MSQTTTVHVKNISSQTSEKEVRDFFSFCGKISSLSVTPADGAQSAAVTFEKPTAAKTALLLDNTQLGSSLVQVTSAATLEEMSNDKSGLGVASAHNEEDVAQEDKPRSRIIAEYLAQGYTISDKVIERAISLDNQNGYSSRFTSALQAFDAKFHATDNTKALDQKYGVTEKAYAGLNGLHSYFEKALGTPSGQKLLSFYEAGNKQVMDVHTEARRLADMKSSRIAGMEHIAGSDKTKCSCGGDSGKCPCESGKCACGSCPKNAASSSNVHMEKQADGKTKCSCGGDSGKCPCESGKCACGSCPKNAASSSKIHVEKQADGKTKCNCGGDTGSCPCAAGSCACGDCKNN